MSLQQHDALAAENADLGNWVWRAESKAEWKLADDDWQEFNTKWYGDESVVDASSLPLSFGAMADFIKSYPSLIMVRESYVMLFNYLWIQAMALGRHTGAIITGQPGTGKTLFQMYLLIRLLQRKQIVLFTLDGKWLHLFYHNKVYTTTTLSLAAVRPKNQLPQAKPTQKVFIWSLFDVSEEKEPEDCLNGSTCLPVQTVSPNPVRYKEWQKLRMPIVFGLPLWTYDELMQGLPCQQLYQPLRDALEELSNTPAPIQDPLAIFPGARTILEEYEENIASLSPEKAFEHLLAAAIKRFGYSARDVYSAIFNYDAATQRHQQVFGIKYTELKETIMAISQYKNTDSHTSNRILALTPDNKGPFKGVQWTIDFKSEWVAKNLIDELLERECIEISHIIRFFREVPGGGPLAGRMFEPLAHRHIAETPTGGFWTLTKMVADDSDSPQFKLDASIVPEVRFAKVKREKVRFWSIPTSLEANTYYMPGDPNFTLIDAFTIDLDSSNQSAILWLLQATTSQEHGGSPKGYQNIREIIANLKDQLGEGQPPKKILKTAAGQRKAQKTAAASKPHVNICYILVVPKGNILDDNPDPKGKAPAKNPEWHFPNGWNKNWKTNDHRGDVYCLELPIGSEFTIPS